MSLLSHNIPWAVVSNLALKPVFLSSVVFPWDPLGGQLVIMFPLSRALEGQLAAC